MTTQLTREQKLMAEQVVQLGNIAEAIRAAAMGENHEAIMEEIEGLKSQIELLQGQRAQLQTQLAASTSEVAQLQAALVQATLNNAPQVDPTPDNLNQVMSTLGIDYNESV